jgi:hypothetical protein
VGTNYYHELRANHCAACGRADNESLHIGKSSAGWCFGLHIYPDKGINTLGDWVKRLESGGIIRDEYGEEITVGDMLAVIVARKYSGVWAPGELAANVAAPGPHGLARIAGTHSLQRGVTHGPGTWDLCPYEFS